MAGTQRIGDSSDGDPGRDPDGTSVHPFLGLGDDQLLLEHAPNQRDPSSSGYGRTRLLSGKLSGEHGAHGPHGPLGPSGVSAGHADRGEVVGSPHGVGVYTTPWDRPNRSGRRFLGHGVGN